MEIDGGSCSDAAVRLKEFFKSGNQDGHLVSLTKKLSDYDTYNKLADIMDADFELKQNLILKVNVLSYKLCFYDGCARKCNNKRMNEDSNKNLFCGVCNGYEARDALFVEVIFYDLNNYIKCLTIHKV